MAISQNTKIIGIGSYGAEVVKFISANLYSDTSDSSYDDRLKFVMADVKVSDFVTKALLNNTQLIIAIADASEGIEALNSILAVAKKEKKTSVALIKGDLALVSSNCDCFAEINSPLEAKGICECITQSMYASSLVAASMEDIVEILENGGKADFTVFEGDLESVKAQIGEFGRLKEAKGVFCSMIIDLEKYADAAYDALDVVEKVKNDSASAIYALSAGGDAIDSYASFLTLSE